MGMFDSFYVKDQEVQTKSLDCSLHSYHLGNVVPNYTGNFDGPTGTYYLVEDVYLGRNMDKEWYGLVIINNIFVDAIRAKTEEDARRLTEQTFNLLKSRPEYLASLLSTIIKSNIAPDLAIANHKLISIRSIMHDYRASKKPKDTTSRLLGSLNSKEDLFRNGADLGPYIQDILDGKYLNQTNDEDLLADLFNQPYTDDHANDNDDNDGGEN